MRRTHRRDGGGGEGALGARTGAGEQARGCRGEGCRAFREVDVVKHGVDFCLRRKRE